MLSPETLTEKQICKSAEGRGFGRFNVEKPARHARGDAMWAAGCTSLKFRGEVKGKVDMWECLCVDGS